MNNKTLADKLTTELTGVLQYVVTDDIQLFSKDTKLGGQEYVPVLLETTSSFENENRYTLIYSYLLTFKVRNALVDSFYTDIFAFKEASTTEAVGSYILTKVVEAPLYVTSSVDNGTTYREYTVELRYTYTLGKVGTATTVTVNAVEIPFTSAQVIHDISYISNQTQATNYRMNNDTVILNIPLITANAMVSTLYGKINSSSYNDVFTVVIDGVSRELVLKRGEYTFNNSATITGMILTFETHYPRVEITLDGVAIPVSAYIYNGKKVVEMSPRVNDIQKSYSTAKVRTWSVTIIKHVSVVWDKLFADAYGEDIQVTYTLDVGLATNFTVELVDSKEQFTETGDMFIECQFQEVS